MRSSESDRFHRQCRTTSARAARAQRSIKRIIQRLVSAIPEALLIAMIFCSSQITMASKLVDEAMAARQRGDVSEALKIWEQLGNAGDAGAMVEAGAIYQFDIKTQPAYEKALDWYWKSQTDDALNYTGVMYRDGTGVRQNRKISYLLFLTVHMSGSNASAITRTNQNLRREIAELPKQQIKEALCYTTDYLKAYIKSKGNLVGIPRDLRASPDRKRFKELGWWAEGEIGPYDCDPET